MGFLEIPWEVLQIILIYAVLNRGLKRALRLRLVCRTFAIAVHPAVFETHLMDDHVDHALGSYDWQTQHQHGADKLWHDYLVYRVMEGSTDDIGRLGEIKKIAQQIHREPENTLESPAIVEGLCWLALTHGIVAGPEIVNWWRPLIPKGPELRARLHHNTILSAAAYFNLPELARRLVAQGRESIRQNYLFAPPIQVAAQTGNRSMLQFFQEKLDETKYEPWSVIGAAIRGDIDMIKLALREPESSIEASYKGKGKIRIHHKFGSIEWKSETGRSIVQARGLTTNPEVYDYLTSCLAPFRDISPLLHQELRAYAERGSISMVRHLLDLGAPLQVPRPFPSPLVMACRGFHTHVAELLLERGADPNFINQRVNPFFPIHEAATASNLRLLRKLLSYDGRLNHLGDSPMARFPVLWWAFARENTPVIEFLLEHGASFDGGSGELWRKNLLGMSLAAMTYDLGYDSMADILRQKGFEIAGPYSSRQFDQIWHDWGEAKVTVQPSPDPTLRPIRLHTSH